MSQGLINSLPEQDRLLLAETTASAIRDLSEDELMDLHRRVRKQRNKYVSVYRRKGAKKVKKSGGRGTARPKNRRNADRVEAFEDALSRVSRQLAVAARASANQLRTERIAAARAAKATTARPTATRATARKTTRTPARKSPAGDAAPVATAAKVGDRAVRSPASTRRRAQTQAANVRRQAARDSG